MCGCAKSVCGGVTPSQLMKSPITVSPGMCMMKLVNSRASVVNFFFFAAREQVDRFVSTLQTCSSGTKHIISRSNVILNLFSSEEILKEFPLRIKYDTEIAYDTGGVLRDMSAFWEQELFDGGAVLTPLLHAQVDMTTFPLLGKILSHGYFVAGYLLALESSVSNFGRNADGTGCNHIGRYVDNSIRK